MENKKKNVIIIDTATFPNGFVRKIKKNFRGFKFIILDNFDKKNLHRKVENAHVLINCPRSFFTEELFNKFYKMEWVHTSAAGIEQYMIPSLIQSNITFTNGKILQGPEVADHAVSILLAFTRNLKMHLSNRFYKVKRPLELLRKKVLIVGFGGIGKCLYERLTGFGMDIDIISEEIVPILHNVGNFYEIDQITKVAKNYDVIISAAPLTKTTTKIFNYDFFNKMKKNSIFINVSRGGLVDTKALMKDKLIKKFWGIGLDVVDPEPLPKNHFLRKKENVIITNHTAGLSDKNRSRAYDLIFNNLKRYKDNKMLFNEVNKNEGY